MHVKNEERGVLDLNFDELLKWVAEKQSQWNPPDLKSAMDIARWIPPSDWFNMTTKSWLVGTVTSSLRAVGNLHLCLFCNSNTMARALQALLFANTIADTGSPALALQAFLTLGLQTEYHVWIPSFDTEGNATTVFFVERLAAVRDRDYWVVLGIICAHTVICTTTIFLFLKRTKYSLLGNVWAFFGPLASSEAVQSVLVQGSLTTDKEISKQLKRSDGFRRRYCIVANKEDDSVTLAPFSEFKAKKHAYGTVSA